jgi:DNA polymerase (family 10)
MDKNQVADILDEIGTLLELQGENVFKTRAYGNAARTLRGLTDDLEELVKSGRLREVKGIGEALSEKITELVKTGRLRYYENLRAQIPAGLLELLRIPGLGPKKAQKLFGELRIDSIDKLEKACKEDRLLNLEGFGAKSQEKFLAGIQQVRQFSGRHLYHHTLHAAAPLLEAIRKHPKIIRAEMAGSLRRHKETIKDIDIVASCKDKDRAELMDFFTTLPGVHSVTAKGDTKSSVVLEKGIPADFRLLKDEQFPYLLHHLTGSAEHNIAMRSLAQKQGIKVSEHGLFKGDKLIKCKDEADIFKTLGMSYVPPELREDNGEIEAAQKNKIPRLIEKEDLRGMLHCHSTYSDGANTIEEMAKATRAMGLEYFGLCDHSMSVAYANGLKPDRVKKQQAEIDKLNEKMKPFKIFKGTECDILPDGGLDYPDKVLESFDFVVASIHSKMNMAEDEATKRIIKAMEHPAVRILGHLTGRLLLERDGYPVNHRKIIDAAAELGVCIEINASPYRFDLDWRYCKYARDKGVLISINPDSHAVDGLREIYYGVGIARKGWLRKEDVLNTRPLKEFEKWVKAKRK